MQEPIAVSDSPVLEDSTLVQNGAGPKDPGPISSRPELLRTGFGALISVAWGTETIVCAR